MSDLNVRVDDTTVERLDQIKDFLGVKTRAGCVGFLVAKFWRDNIGGDLQEMA